MEVLWWLLVLPNGAVSQETINTDNPTCWCLILKGERWCRYAQRGRLCVSFSCLWPWLHPCTASYGKELIDHLLIFFFPWFRCTKDRGSCGVEIFLLKQVACPVSQLHHHQRLRISHFSVSSGTNSFTI